MLVVQLIIWVLIFLIFFSLGSALFYLIKSKKSSESVVKALTWRIGLSILLFLFLLIAFAMGWVSPHSL